MFSQVNHLNWTRSRPVAVTCASWSMGTSLAPSPMAKVTGEGEIPFLQMGMMSMEWFQGKLYKETMVSRRSLLLFTIKYTAFYGFPVNFPSSNDGYGMLRL